MNEHMPKHIYSVFQRDTLAIFMSSRFILFVFAYIYLGVVKEEECLRKGVSLCFRFCCHTFDTYSFIQRALPGFGLIFVASRNIVQWECMCLCVCAYLLICVYFSKEIILSGQVREHPLADMKTSLYIFAASMGLERISMEMRSLLFIFPGSQMIH